MTFVVRKATFLQEFKVGTEKALIEHWQEVYCGYGVHEYRYWDSVNEIWKVHSGEAQTPMDIYFTVSFMHQWIKYELKHMTGALVDAVDALTYSLAHNISENHPMMVMRAGVAPAANILETFEDVEYIYPPQTYRFRFACLDDTDWIEPRFTLMERF